MRFNAHFDYEAQYHEIKNQDKNKNLSKEKKYYVISLMHC